MKILCVGGGSGGHVTPVAAVIEELQRLEPTTEIRFICDRKYFVQLTNILRPLGIKAEIISCGKFRRYSNMKWYWHIEHLFKTHMMNFLDIFKICIGIIQSLFKIVIWRPDVIFAKGGFVCLPVGVAASIARVPLVIHDSDASPGLTSRVLSRHAVAIATGMPIKYYPNYPRRITEFVGIPISSNFKKTTLISQSSAKEELGFDPNRPLILATGGGQGASVICELAKEFHKKYLNIQIVLTAGQKQYEDYKKSFPGDDGWLVVDHFDSNDLAVAMRASDIVITRAGATTIAELSIMGAAAILIPSPFLAGDHQTKNAKIYAEADAAVVIDQREMIQDVAGTQQIIKNFLDDSNKRIKYGINLHKFARLNSASRMAKIILKVANA